MNKEEAIDCIFPPSAFADMVLGYTLYPKQKAIVDEFRNQHGRVKVSVVAANGSGKSSIIIPTIALWSLVNVPQARIVITQQGQPAA